jgi:isocitrate/isopropylmalate dehydrogenase
VKQEWHDFANSDYYAKHRQMMPDDWKSRIGDVEMMLDHPGEADAAGGIVRAIERVLADAAARTRDLGGRADTGTCGRAIADSVD